MAIPMYQFLTKDNALKLATELFQKVNLRQDERIVQEVNGTSTDKVSPSAKAVYGLKTLLESADAALTSRLDTQDSTLSSLATKLETITSTSGTIESDIAGLESDLQSLQSLVESFTHLTIKVVIGPISTVTEPDPTVLYFQKDSEDDQTCKIYVYTETYKWIDVGDTEVDLTNYYTKDNNTQLQTDLGLDNWHSVEAVTDPEIESLVEEAFTTAFPIE